MFEICLEQDPEGGLVANRTPLGIAVSCPCKAMSVRYTPRLAIGRVIASVAQRQSTGFVNRRLWVQIPPLALVEDVARLEGVYPSGQRGQTVNLLAHAFGGSNPPAPN